MDSFPRGLLTLVEFTYTRGVYLHSWGLLTLVGFTYTRGVYLHSWGLPLPYNLRDSRVYEGLCRFKIKTF